MCFGLSFEQGPNFVLLYKPTLSPLISEYADALLLFPITKLYPPNNWAQGYLRLNFLKVLDGGISDLVSPTLCYLLLTFL